MNTVKCPKCNGRGYFIGEPKEYDKDILGMWEVEYYNSLCEKVKEKRYECWFR
jgi:hypothetical protein